MYYHRARGIRTLVHGDDYASVGSVVSLRWLKARLEETFDMKTVIAGHSEATDIVREAKILNRVIRATSEGWEYECDQRHAEIMIEAMGLTGSRPLGTPASDDSHKKEDSEEAIGREPLDAEHTTMYRALVARANYMAQDRAELQFPVKELCRYMSAPDADAWARLKRLVKYLVGRPRAVMKFCWQTLPEVLDVYSDANWAGCKLSRKSTSGGTLVGLSVS